MIILAVAVNAMRLLLYEHIFKWFNSTICEKVPAGSAQKSVLFTLFRKGGMFNLCSLHTAPRSLEEREGIKSSTSGLSLDGRVKHPQG
jgi:hypothetical protein